MPRFRTYGKLDSKGQEEHDPRFLGMATALDPTVLPAGFLQWSYNARLETWAIQTRKGAKRLGSDSDGDFATLLASAVYGACYYEHPLYTDGKFVVVFGSDRAFFVSTSDESVTPVLYQAGETITAPIRAMQAGRNLIIWRGESNPLPWLLNQALGKSPLIYEPRVLTDAESKIMKPDTRLVSGATAASPIVITTSKDHPYETGDLVTVNNVAGISAANGTFYVTKLTATTFELDGTSGSGSYSSSTQGYVSSEVSEIPPAASAAYMANRLCVPVSRDEVRFSDILVQNKFNTLNTLQIDAGSSDYIQAVVPVQDEALLVFKRSSIFLVSDINTLEKPVITEITRQMGLSAPRTALMVGGMLFFLSDAGVYAVEMGIRGGAKVGSAAALLQVMDQPVSRDIQDYIREIPANFAHKAVAVFNDNRYYIALPSIHATDSGNYRPKTILIYNVALKAWESADNIGGGTVYIDDLVTGIYNNKQAVFVVTNNGGVLVHEENASGQDQYGTTAGSATTAFADMHVKTRSFNFQKKSIKKWLRVNVTVKSLGTDMGSLGGKNHWSYYSYADNPDEYGGYMAWSVAAPSDPLLGATTLQRTPVRARGQNLFIGITNGGTHGPLTGTATGRVEIRGVSVEGHETTSQTKQYY